MLVTISFYLLAFTAIAAALMVVLARNPVHSVMFLITVFFSAAGLFILMGAEFIALLLVMVYVGAVAVLFLFVVMMLDVDFAELKAGFLEYLPVGFVLGAVLLTEMIMVGAVYFSGESRQLVQYSDEVSNLERFGKVLYTDYAFFFEASGLILLVAMVGAIVLTLRHREGVKKQDITQQVSRTPETAIEMVDLESGKGVGT